MRRLATTVLFLICGLGSVCTPIGFAYGDQPDSGSEAPDGGAADAGLDVPVQLDAGDPAPFAGWLISDHAARLMVVNDDIRDRALEACQADAGQPQVDTSPGCGTMMVAVGAFIGGCLVTYKLLHK